MIDNLKWGTFLLWGVFDLVIAVGVWLFLEETRGLSLEQISGTATLDAPKHIDEQTDDVYGQAASNGFDKAPEAKGPDVEVK